MSNYPFKEAPYPHACAPKDKCSFFRPALRLAPSGVVWKEEVSRGSEGWLEGMCVSACVGVCVSVYVLDCISMYEVRKWKGAYC